MDVLLSQVTRQAMSYAIKSGVTIAATYTVKQCTQLLQQSPQSYERDVIARLQVRLESKIRIMSPAIDMIELITARGHTSLESAESLIREIRSGIQDLGHRLREANEDQNPPGRESSRANTTDETTGSLRQIIVDIEGLIDKIDDAVPLVNLAITTSGVNLSTNLAKTVSPSRLLQASTFLTAADTTHNLCPYERAQVGPTFLVSLYMLFAGHSSRAVDTGSIRNTTWKEVLHKAHVKLIRSPSPGSSYFEYQLVIIEDLDDDRVHSSEAGEPVSGPYDDVPLAGIRETIPIYEVAKLFYADSGKILNIHDDSEGNKPVLLLKRDVDSAPSSQFQRRKDALSPDPSSPDSRPSPTSPEEPIVEQEQAQWSFPPDLDPEWIALEVYAESFAQDDEDNEDGGLLLDTRFNLSNALSALSFRSYSSSPPGPSPMTVTSPPPSPAATVKTSLSLLEMLIKLTALQQFKQQSHLSIEDELLNFFLEESATAGAGSDKARRRKIREYASTKIGFDPYDESPVKQRERAHNDALLGTMPKLTLFSPSEHDQMLSSSSLPVLTANSDQHSR